MVDDSNKSSREGVYTLHDGKNYIGCIYAEDSKDAKDVMRDAWGKRMEEGNLSLVLKNGNGETL